MEIIMAREKCPVCGGSGKEVHFGGMENYYETCHKCNGTGYFGEDDVYRDRSSDSSSSSSYTPSRSGGSSAFEFDYGGDIEALNKTCNDIQIQVIRGKYDEAIAQYDKLIYSMKRGSWNTDVVESVEKLRESAIYSKKQAEAEAQQANTGGSSSASASAEELVAQGVAAENKGDNAKAFELYSKAANMGDKDGQFYLGYAYYDGQGVSQDFAKAVEWYRKAAAQGNSASMLCLGEMYRDGVGVKQDYAKAIEWFQKAIADDHDGACIALGILYRDGTGVSQDFAKAEKLFNKAIKLDNEEAEEELAKLKQMRGK